MKTFNRVPDSVYVPTESKVGYNYFNYTQWKGKCTDKNYIGVDQETFEDCENVYIDTDGVLRSRPMVRIATDVGLQGVKDMWTFGEWTVYQTMESRTIDNVAKFVYPLYFQNPKKQLSTGIVMPKDVKLVLADEKIYIFTSDNVQYFDLTDSTLYTAKLYIPITKTYANNVESDTESPNELTTSYRKRYVWSRQAETSLVDVIGKKVEIKIDDDKFTVTSFEKNQQLTFCKPTFTFTSDNMLNHIPLVDIGENNTVLLTTKSSATMYSFAFSVDGISFTELEALPQTESDPYVCLGVPKISHNGTEVIVMTSKGPYAISVLPDGDTFRYPTWTNLFEYFSTIITSSELPTITVNDKYATVYMYDYSTFGFIIHAANSNQYTAFVFDELYYWTRQWIMQGHNYVPFVVRKNYDKTKTFLAYVVSTVIDDTEKNLIVSGFEGSTETEVITKSFKLASAGEDEWDWTVPIFSSSLFFENATVYVADVAIHKSADDTPIGSLVNIVKYDISTNSFSVVNSYSLDTIDSRIAAYSSTFIVTDKQAIINYEPVKLYQEMIPLGATSYIYGYTATDSTHYQAYTSNFNDEIEIIETVYGVGRDTYLFDCEAELQDYFISFGNKLLVSESGAYADGFQWYFPTIKTQEFDYEITGLHPISTTELAIFFSDSIYYAVPTTYTINQVERQGYAYYKSRLPLGCKKGSDIVTSFDGKYTVFSTKRGLVAMAYQDFINSSEQALNFLSDTILEDYTEWAIGAVKITPYKFWFIIYQDGDERSFVFDLRNNSWWDMRYNNNPHKVIPVDNKVYVVHNQAQLCYLDTSDEDYHDEHAPINWYLASQKLHFNAVNYYKHVVNLTLSAVSTATKEFTCKMNVNIFRKAYNENVRPDLGIAYQVEMVRVYVRRINYMKLNEFQFVLRSDNDAVVQVPLSLTNISIKFKATGQVR